MIWSKLKKSIEALLADAVKQHLQIHVTRYGPGVSAIMNRGWITWDGQEINTFSTIQWIQAQNALAPQRNKAEETQMDSYSAEQVKYLLGQRDIYSYQDFYIALEEYLSLSIEDALQSDSVLIRAWVMFDRRLGKRQLRAMSTQQFSHALIQKWYQLRCQAEEIIAVQHLSSE